MGLFDAIVRTVINTATLPVAVAKDACTLGGELIDEESATAQHLDRIKREADPDFDDDLE